MSTKFGDKMDVVGAAVSVTTGVTNPPAPENMWDRSHPRSFIALVPKSWADAFESAQFEREDLFALDERELYATLRREQKTPNAILNTIRLKLWMEYERCQASESKRIEVLRVLGEVCRSSSFEKFILSRPERVAWLMCAPTSYRMKLEEALDFGMSKLRDILDLDVVEARIDKNGQTRYVANVKLGELQAKIVNMLDVRKHGAAKQRIEQTSRSMHINLNADARDVSLAMEESTGDDLDRQIRELEWRERQALNLPAVDVQASGKVAQEALPIDAEISISDDDNEAEHRKEADTDAMVVVGDLVNNPSDSDI